VCLGSKKSRQTSFALLNHTTRQSKVQVQNLFSLREGGSLRQTLFVLGLLFGVIVSIFVAVFGGAPWLLPIWFLLLIAFAVEARRGKNVDIQPLWNRASAEAQPLLASM
jgi:hypothetical protein